MKTAAEYRAMAEECFKWASEARTDAVRESYLQLAQVWLNTASKLDGLPATRTAPVTDDVTKTTRAAGAEPTTPKDLTS
jgi:hypothetical protein